MARLPADASRALKKDTAVEKREIESLRDLAIDHYPKARKQRAEAIQYGGRQFADVALRNASHFDDPEATAIEKQARELLFMTFLHPSAPLIEPFDFDDAESIARRTEMREMCIEMQPQVEAAMLEAARLLCRLAGVALPPWMVETPILAAKAEPGPITNPIIKAWKINARQIGETILQDKPTLNVEQLAVKVHKKMIERKAEGDPGMTGRGGKVPSPSTIKKWALRGIKS